jgi:putrescine transport system ATP-binding protein
MFEGRVIEDEEDHIRIRSLEAGCDIYVGHGVACAPNQTLWFALRPEKISLVREKPKGDANFTQGVVEDVVYLGDMSIYRVLLESGKPVVVTRPNIRRNEPGAITWDEKVYLTWGELSGSVLTS